MILASVVFFISLMGIAGLFAVKYVEEHQQKAVVPPELRKRADERAIQLKVLLLAKRAEASKLPGTLLHLGHVAVHAAALEAAHGCVPRKQYRSLGLGEGKRVAIVNRDAAFEGLQALGFGDLLSGQDADFEAEGAQALAAVVLDFLLI